AAASGRAPHSRQSPTPPAHDSASAQHSYSSAGIADVRTPALSPDSQQQRHPSSCRKDPRPPMTSHRCTPDTPAKQTESASSSATTPHHPPPNSHSSAASVSPAFPLSHPTKQERSA